MKLTTVHVTNFRSVDDSGEFNVNPITCLVGKNEAGKSAILLALAALNSHDSTPISLEKERDYPRSSLTNYEKKHGNNDAVAIKTIWQLEEADMNKLNEAVGDKVVISNLVTISRKYNKNIDVTAELDFKIALNLLYTKFSLSAPERSSLNSAKTTTELINVLSSLAAPTPKHQELLAYMNKVGILTTQVSNLILKMMPKFMYFSAYDRMDGAIQLENTKALINNGQISLDIHRGARLFADFLDYAGVSIDDITSLTTYETFNAMLQAASNAITDQILEYWTQNPDLRVDVRVEKALSGDAAPLNTGTIARARIYNALHRVDTPFSERSAGFVWFFSFLVKFTRVKNDGQPILLLLDEPGLTLHGKAQADLLRFFKEKLEPYHQIIYSTHSPFMVPTDDFSSVRIVEDQVEVKGARRHPLGTKVRDNVLSRDPDTLFPLQGALGYEISQSLFIGENTLLLEGPGDILYMQALSNALVAKGREGLDPRWTMCPAGGIDKISPFVSLFSGNAINIAVLSDQALGDNKKIGAMKKSDILKAGHFYTMADFLERAEADIEDVFDPELFVIIVNKCYGLVGANELTVKKIKDADASTERLLKQVESAFRVMPESVPMYDHFTPAAWLIRNLGVLDGETAMISKTLTLAEKIFKTYNKLL